MRAEPARRERAELDATPLGAQVHSVHSRSAMDSSEPSRRSPAAGHYMDQLQSLSDFAQTNNADHLLDSDSPDQLSALPAGPEGPIYNEPLIGGFALLRAVQLLNLDVYYIGLSCNKCNTPRRGDLESTSRPQHSFDPDSSRDSRPRPGALGRPDEGKAPPPAYHTFLDKLADYNPLQKYIDRSRLAGNLCRVLKICLSFLAIMICVDQLISTIVLCLFARKDIRRESGLDRAATNNNMGLFVLFLVNLSSLYILFSTVFNGHQLWNLLSQRLFLVSRRFQCKTMIGLMVFIYLEYLIRVAFINNLYEWNLSSEEIESENSSLLVYLKNIVLHQNDQSYYLDLLLTVGQFARGIIRISPYITINYAMICLREHISAIRNQRLLVKSRKRHQRLRLVMIDKRAKLISGLAVGKTPAGRAVGLASERKKKVSFVTGNGTVATAAATKLSRPIAAEQKPASQPMESSSNQEDYLARIRDFNELESYITNLYIFTGRLNRFMSHQGMTMFFIVHNLVICGSLIMPESVRGGPLMANLIRFLLILIGLLPFIHGQSLIGQLEQLSKQVDRIIIQQQFIQRRRDNLVRIRELIHDIRVNCGGMVNFNIEAGIKYLVIAFASAFFIEQEHYKLTRRH